MRRTLMNYLKKNLIDDERIIIKANLTNFIYINELFVFVLIFMYILYIRLFIESKLDIFLCALPYILIAIFYYIRQLIKDLTTELVITNKRVLGRRGFIKIETLDTSLVNIDNVQVKVTFIGRILRYGSISIETKSDNYEYKLIKNPIKLKKKIMEEIIKAKE